MAPRPRQFSPPRLSPRSSAPAGCSVAPLASLTRAWGLSPADDARQRTSPRPAFGEDGRFVLEQETNSYAVLPESQWPGYRPPQEPPVPCLATCGAIQRPCSQRSLRRLRRAIWRARCTSPGQRPEGRPGSRPGAARAGVHGARTREIYRSARDAEKPAPGLKPTCNSLLWPADRRKEGALNKRRRKKAVLRAGGLEHEEASARAVNAGPWEPPPGMVKLRCERCRYWFAAPSQSAEPRWPDCASFGQRAAELA